jgi:hypothetical protein
MMADEKNITIVIRAKDEFSDVLGKIAGAAESSGESIKKAYGTSMSAEAKGAESYVSALSKIIELESARGNASNAVDSGKPSSGPVDASPDGAQARARGTLASLTGPTVTAPEDEVSRAWLGYQAQLEALEQFNARRLELLQAAGLSEVELAAENARMVNAFAAQKRDFQLAAAAETFGGMSNIMQNLMVATGSRNKTMFKAMQGFAIAESLINTYQGATKAYATVPYPMNFVAAASVIAAGMAQVAKIRSQSPQGGGGAAISAGGTAAATYSGGSFNAYPVPTRLTEDSRPTQNVTVQIYNPLSTQNWSEIVENSIIPALNDAADRNISVTVSNM